MAPNCLPATFLLDVQAELEACAELIPPASHARLSTPYALIMDIALHLVLDAIPMVEPLPDEQRVERISTLVNTYASHDIQRYQYQFKEEVSVALYQWYFSTYLTLFAQLNHFFPRFYLQEEGLAYTVKQYGTLLRFDQIPQGRDFTELDRGI